MFTLERKTDSGWAPLSTKQYRSPDYIKRMLRKLYLDEMINEPKKDEYRIIKDGKELWRFHGVVKTGWNCTLEWDWCGE